MRIVDSSELTLLKQTAITNVLERNYEQQDQAFADLVEAFSSDRDDSRIIQTVEALYEFTRSHPPQNGWMKKRLCINISNRLLILLGTNFAFLCTGSGTLLYYPYKTCAGVDETGRQTIRNV